METHIQSRVFDSRLERECGPCICAVATLRDRVGRRDGPTAVAEEGT
jgi:hypothetical protein